MITAVVYTEQDAIRLCANINNYSKPNLVASFRKGHSISETEGSMDSWTIRIDLPIVDHRLARTIVDTLKPNPTLTFDPE